MNFACIRVLCLLVTHVSPGFDWVIKKAWFLRLIRDVSGSMLLGHCGQLFRLCGHMSQGKVLPFLGGLEIYDKIVCVKSKVLWFLQVKVRFCRFANESV